MTIILNKIYVISIFTIFSLIILPFPLIYAQNVEQKSNDITFTNEMVNLGINYQTKYLPKSSSQYGNKSYQVRPVSIWWHWDAGATPYSSKNISQRLISTYNILKQRTEAGDPVSVHFCVGPNAILQMLPMEATTITQGRLTNDSNIQNVTKSLSLGGIQIETTGTYYNKNPPLNTQSTTLIKLTALLMKQYNIPFANIYGHLEKSPYISKIDPGIKYLNKTRIQLLKYLIANKQIENIGPVKSWNFYKQEINNKILINKLDQSSSEIFQSLTKEEQTVVVQIK